MYDGKPIIGLLGGIGSGKSFVASILGELGCAVISADELVAGAYDDPVVRQTIKGWGGQALVRPDGTIDRNAIADLVFSNSAQRRRLESLLHPIVAIQRDRCMAALSHDDAIRAYVWDTPLLVESGMDKSCDAL